MGDHRRQIRRLKRDSLLSAGVVLAVVLSLAAMCFGAVVGYLDQTALPAAWGPAAATALALVGMLSLAANIARDVVTERPRIVPYFESRVITWTEAWAAFQRGYGLAADLEALDRLSSQTGSTSLSSLGFADDLYRQPVTWFNADVGLECITALRVRMAESRCGLCENTEGDLEALARVLDRAAESGTRFSLVIRLGTDNYIYPLEMDRRSGTFF